MKLWTGRFSKETAAQTNDFNSSISIDGAMYRQDIKGSLAHAAMLCDTGIISADDYNSIESGLVAIAAEIESGELVIPSDAEDIHTFIEGELTARVGDAGKRLHTARSRNDQVALDTRLYLRDKCGELNALLYELAETLCSLAEKYSDAIMPGYTHLQRAQPVTFGHYMLAYGEMLLRDLGRLKDAVRRMNVSPLGSCALAGTTYPTDRQLTAALLGMDGVCRNSLDGVSDRDFCMEIASAMSIIMVHLSRLSEEIVLWCSHEFKFIELDDAFATGSSIMPQKKNPDIAELIRGKSGRVIGDTVTLLTVMKGLPLAYNKDMQEDKEAVFDAVETVKACLIPLIPMLKTMTVRRDNMRAAAAGGFINATDCADFLVSRGMPFRDAYKITGSIVAYCERNGKTLENLTLEEYKSFSELFDDGVYQAVSLEACVAGRTSEGGPAPENVKKEASMFRLRLREYKDG